LLPLVLHDDIIVVESGSMLV